VSKWAKLIRRILDGRSDASVAFSDLRGLLLHLGFEERTRGGHHVFRREGVDEKVNLQRDDGKAKPYQVRQIRQMILKYGLGKLDDA
jgi:hypothetical protein